MKIARVNPLALDKLGTLLPRDLLSGEDRLSAEVDRAVARVRRAEKQLQVLLGKKEKVLSRRQRMVDSGDLRIITEATAKNRKVSLAEQQNALIDAWMTSGSAQEVANKLGMKVDTVRHAAMRRRKEGVPLPSRHREFTPEMIKLMVETGNASAPGAHFLDPVAFIALWQSSKSRAEVARITGLSPNACSIRSRQYRKLGVKLKSFPKGRKKRS